MSSRTAAAVTSHSTVELQVMICQLDAGSKQQISQTPVHEGCVSQTNKENIGIIYTFCTDPGSY